MNCENYYVPGVQTVKLLLQLIVSTERQSFIMIESHKIRTSNAVFFRQEKAQELPSRRYKVHTVIHLLLFLTKQ